MFFHKPTSNLFPGQQILSIVWKKVAGKIKWLDIENYCKDASNTHWFGVKQTVITIDPAGP